MAALCWLAIASSSRGHAGLIAKEMVRFRPSTSTLSTTRGRGGREGGGGGNTSRPADQSRNDEDDGLSSDSSAQAISYNAASALPEAQQEPRYSGIRPVSKADVHRITSGQVILELQSVVKELVENSLDAGATSIEVRFRDYGKEGLEVVDNGTGIKAEDYEAVALKHHTSKIEDFADLSLVRTFGFRGEALSAVCAHAEVTILTATAEEAPMGTLLEFDSMGRLQDGSKKLARQRGCTVTVGGLFHGLPVRRRELEKNAKREFGKAHGLLQAYALIAKGVRWNVVNTTAEGRKNGVMTVSSAASGDWLSRNFASLFGAKAPTTLQPLDLKLHCSQPQTNKRYRASSMHEPLTKRAKIDLECTLQDDASDLSVDENQSESDAEGHDEGDQALNFQVTGLISKPLRGSGRNSADRQYLYINGRPWDSVKVIRTFNEVYRQYNSTQVPVLIANFTLPTDRYDVNVSPDKRTVFLHDEQVLIEALRTALDGFFEPIRGTLAVNSAPGASQPSYTQSKLSGFRPSHDAPALAADPQWQSGGDSEAEQDDEDDDEQAMETVLLPSPSTSVRIFSPPPDEDADDSGLLGSARALPSERSEHIVNDDPALRHTFNFGKSQSHGPGSGLGRSPQAASISASQQRLTQMLATFESKKAKTGRPATATSLVNQEEDVEDDDGEAAEDEDDDGRAAHVGDDPDMEYREEDEVGSAAASDDVSQADEVFGKDDGFSVFEDPQDKPAGESSKASDTRDHTPSATVDTLLSKHRSLDDSEIDVDEQERHLAQLDEAPQTTPPADTIAVEERADTRLASNDGNLTVNVSIEAISRFVSMHSRSAKASKSPYGEGTNGSKEGAVSSAAGIANVDAGQAEKELQRVISKTDFEAMEILGQFNLGFIVARRRLSGHEGQSTMDDLFVIDQHAADEKFNFETLQAQTKTRSQKLIHPRSLELSAADELVAQQHLDAIRANGFDISIDEEAIAGSRISLVSQPVSKDIVFGVRDLEELLFSLRDTAPNSTKALSMRCSKARSMFASRACRKSVMIGTALNTRQMTTIVKHMGTIEQPWNCPHGRPTMRHLACLRAMPVQHRREVDWSKFQDLDA